MIRYHSNVDGQNELYLKIPVTGVYRHLEALMVWVCDKF